jgi:hypothetical protein
MSGHNNPHHGLARFSWGEFDRLPAQLRWVLNYSVFEMGTDYIVELLNEGVPPADLAVELEQLDARTSVRAALETYGPRHPACRQSWT